MSVRHDRAAVGSADLDALKARSVAARASGRHLRAVAVVRVVLGDDDADDEARHAPEREEERACARRQGLLAHGQRLQAEWD